MDVITGIVGIIGAVLIGVVIGVLWEVFYA